MTDYLDANEFEAYLSFHTQGQIFYWEEDSKRQTNLNKLIRADTGFPEYRDASDEGEGGSFYHYVYGKFGRAVMTVELCRFVGNYPYPDARFDEVWAPAKNIILIFGDVISKF